MVFLLFHPHSTIRYYCQSQWATQCVNCFDQPQQPTPAKTSSTLLYWGTQKGWSTRVIAEITFIAIEGGVWGKPSYHRNKNIEHNTEWNLFFSSFSCCCFSMFPKHFLKLCEAIGNHWKDICRYQNHLNLLNGGRGRGRGSRADTSIKRVVRTRTSKCGWNTNKLPEEIPPLKFYRVE